MTDQVSDLTLSDLVLGKKQHVEPVTPAAPAPPDDSLHSDFVAARTQTNPIKSAESFLDEGAETQGTQAEAARPLPDQNQTLARQILQWHDKANDIAASVAKDVGKGLMGAPAEVAGGALDYVNHLFKFADDAVKTAEKAGLPNIYFQLLDKDGKFAPRTISTEQFRAEQASGSNQVFQVPTTDQPDSVTGSIVRTGTSFLIGRGNLAKGGGVGSNLLADAASGATSMDPDSPRLSNIVDSIAPNFITDFLKAKPEDEGTMLGHLKSGLEMAGLGAAVTGVIRAVKALKAADAGPASVGGEEPALGKPDLTAPEVDVTAKSMTAEEAAAFDKANPEPAVGAENVASTPEPKLGAFADMKDDLPWAEDQGTQLVPDQTAITAAKNAKAGGGVMEFPDKQAMEMLAIGKPEEPIVSFEPTAAHQEGAKEFLGQEAGTMPAPLEIRNYMGGNGANPIRVNLGRIGSSDDIKDAIARVAKFIPRAETVSHDETIWAADGSGLTPEQLLARYGGGTGLPEQIAEARANLLAARFIRDSGADQLVDYAKAAVAPGAGPEAKAKAIRAFATQMALQQEVSGATTEAGRLLESLKIKSQTRAEAGKQIQNIIEQAGGQQSVDQLLGRIATIDSPEEAARAVTAAGKMSARDWMLYGSYNAYLSPRTILKKLTSDGLMGMWNLATRYAAATYSDDITVGQVNQLAYGYATSFKDGIRAATKAMKAGSSQFAREYSSMDALHYGRIAQLSETAAPETTGQAAMSYAKMGMPTTWIGAVDDFAKTINYRAALRYNAYGEAVSSGATAEEAKSSVETIMAQKMQDVPDALHNRSVQDALQNTFQEPLQGVGAKIKDFVDGINLPVGHGSQFEIPMGRMLVPFIKIPANIMAWAYRNSPLPLMSMSSAVKADMMAGGAAKDLAMARIGLGTGLVVSTLGLAVSGRLTGGGPSSPELKKAWLAAGHDPYTLDLGSGKFKYNQLEPMGTTLGVIADTLEIMKFAKEEDKAALAESLVFGTGKAMLNKSYLMGVGEFFQALENPDEEASRWASNFAAGLSAPQTISGVAKGLDEWKRAHYGYLQTVESRIPGLSQNLPPARTRWGDPIPWNEAFLPGMSGTGLARAISPFETPKHVTEPIDKWIWENRLAFPRGPENKLGLPGVGGPIQTFTPPGSKGVVAQVELTPEQLDRYKVLAGNELKDPTSHMGAKDTLNALVNGTYPSGLQQQWDKASAAGKALVVQSAVNKFKTAAKMQLIEEYPDLKEALTAGWQQKVQQLQPAAMNGVRG